MRASNSISVSALPAAGPPAQEARKAAWNQTRMSEQQTSETLPQPVALDPAVEQRILHAMNFEEGDRVPIWDYMDNAAALERFAPGETDLLAANVKVYHGLGIDLCRGFGASYAPSRDGEQDCNADGVVHGVISGQTRWAVRRPINTIDELKAYDPPAPRDIEEVRPGWVEWMRKVQAAFAPHTMHVPGHGCGFHGTYDMMGLQLFSYAIHDCPAAVERLIEANNAPGVEIAKIAAEEQLCPLFFIGDDIAYKQRLMFSPDFLRRTFIRALRNMCEPLRRAGIKVIFHSDGDVTDVIDAMLDAGISGLNPIEPMAGMDIGLLKRRYGKELILVGNVDCSQVLPLGTVDEVREATKECIRQASPGGGHFIGSSSEITPSTPLENILAFYDACRNYGRYPIRV